MNNRSSTKLVSLFLTMVFVFGMGYLPNTKADAPTANNILMGLPTFTVDGSTQIYEASSASNKVLKAVMPMENTSSAQSDAEVILAAYKDDALINVATEKIDLAGNAKNENFDISIDLTDTTVDTVRLFSLSSLESIVPGKSKYVLYKEERTPTAPTNFRLVYSNTTVATFAWDKSSDDTVVGYKVTRDGELVANLDMYTTQVDDRDFWVNKTHEYKVQSVNLKGVLSTEAALSFDSPKGASMIAGASVAEFQYDQMEATISADNAGDGKRYILEDQDGISTIRCLSGDGIPIKAMRSQIPTTENNLVVKIRFYDPINATSGNIRLFQYNATNNYGNDSENLIYQNIYVPNSNTTEWRTAVVQIRNAAFNGQASGGDFRILPTDRNIQWVQILKGTRYEPYPEGACIMDMAEEIDNGNINGLIATMPVSTDPTKENYLERANIADKECIKVSGGKYAYVNVADKNSRAYIDKTDTHVKFKFEYFDAAEVSNVSVKIEYNATDDSNENTNDAFRTLYVPITNTNQWKTAVLYVTDAQLRNAANGNDYRLSAGGNTIYLRNIQTIKLPGTFSGPLKNAPTSVIAYADGDNVQIKWNAVHDKFNVDSYKVYKGADTSPVYSGKDLSYVDNNQATSIDANEYSVSAVDIYGNESYKVPVLVTVKNPVKYYYDFTTGTSGGLTLGSNTGIDIQNAPLKEVNRYTKLQKGASSHSDKTLDIKVPEDVGKNVKVTVTLFDSNSTGNNNNHRLKVVDPNSSDAQITLIFRKSTERWVTHSFILRDFDFDTSKIQHLRFVRANDSNDDDALISYISVESLTGNEKAEFSVQPDGNNITLDLLRMSVSNNHFDSAKLYDHLKTIGERPSFELFNTGGNATLSFDIHPGFINNSNDGTAYYPKKYHRPDITIKVTYFDQKAAHTEAWNNFNVSHRYWDGTNNTEKSTEIKHQNDGMWKTHVLHIEDASFYNRPGDQDWNVQIKGFGTVVSKVEVIPGYVD